MRRKRVQETAHIGMARMQACVVRVTANRTEGANSLGKANPAWEMKLNNK